MPNLQDYRAFLRAGYSLQELAAAFVRLKLVSPVWTRLKYPLRKRGARVCIDYSVDIAGARYIAIGDDSWIQRHAWLVVPLIEMATVEDRPYLSIGKRVQIGRNTLIAAANSIEVEDDVLIAPRVTIVDSDHHYADGSRPIKDQGISYGEGSVRIGRGSFIGVGAVILGQRGLTIGAHAVVGAQSVVTSSIPAYSVALGNPARVVRTLLGEAAGRASSGWEARRP